VQAKAEQLSDTFQMPRRRHHSLRGVAERACRPAGDERDDVACKGLRLGDCELRGRRRQAHVVAVLNQRAIADRPHAARTAHREVWFGLDAPALQRQAESFGERVRPRADRADHGVAGHEAAPGQHDPARLDVHGAGAEAHVDVARRE
jgi:hypothetical protein